MEQFHSYGDVLRHKNYPGPRCGAAAAEVSPVSPAAAHEQAFAEEVRMTAVVERPRSRVRSEVEYRLARAQREWLTPLVAELRWRGYAAELVRFRDPLRFALRVLHPRRGELPDDLVRDTVFWFWCRRGADRVWWFEWPWGERLTASADFPGAADYVADLLGPARPEGGDR